MPSHFSRADRAAPGRRAPHRSALRSILEQRGILAVTLERLVVCASFAFLIVACGSSDGASSGSSSSSSSSSGGSSSSSSGGSSSGTPFSTQVKNGVITYYDADGSGSCSYDPSPNDLDVAAFDLPEFAGSAACGSCVHVTGPKGEVTVRIVDSCPECEQGHLDLSREAFAKIADIAAGHVEVTYQTVACNVTGPLAYHYKDGSSIYWTAIQVRNHRLPVVKLEYKKNGSYVAMPRMDYNYFVDENGVGDQPNGLALRVTAADGQVVEDVLAGGVQADTTIQGTARFK
jgi:expansin (peptidoglycan-binding protein)